MSLVLSQCGCGEAREGLGGAVGGHWVSLIKAVGLVSAEECAGHKSACVR